MDQQLRKIIGHFLKEAVQEVAPIDEGLINSSYLVKAESNSYILQRINKEVFGNAAMIMENIEMVHNHLKKDPIYQIPEIIKTIDDQLLYEDADGFSWRMMLFIPDSKTFNTTEDLEVAKEAGSIIGRFHTGTKELDASMLHTILPNFHDLNFRADLFLGSLQNAKKERLAEAAPYILQAENLIDDFVALNELPLPLRVTHNDTKLNNILFDAVSSKALCLIDLDTLMPGNFHHDFGDAVRTLCNTVSENEIDLSLLDFNWELFKAFSTGYFEKMTDSLVEEEWSVFPLSVELMPFIMGLRFLTDYLYGDVYYKVEHSEQNLDRCKNQFALVEKVRASREEIGSHILSFRRG